METPPKRITYSPQELRVRFVTYHLGLIYRLLCAGGLVWGTFYSGMQYAEKFLLWKILSAFIVALSIWSRKFFGHSFKKTFSSEW